MVAHNEQKWYAKRKDLSMNEPIICENHECVEILLPVIQFNKGYKIEGYAWFNLQAGHWNSCHVWDTAEAAIADRRPKTIYNAEIDVVRFREQI